MGKKNRLDKERRKREVKKIEREKEKEGERDRQSKQAQGHYFWLFEGERRATERSMWEKGRPRTRGGEKNFKYMMNKISHLDIFLRDCQNYLHIFSIVFKHQVCMFLI